MEQSFRVGLTMVLRGGECRWMKRGGRKRKKKEMRIMSTLELGNDTLQAPEHQLGIMACDARPLWGGPYNVALVARFFPDRNFGQDTETWPPSINDNENDYEVTLLNGRE